MNFQFLTVIDSIHTYNRFLHMDLLSEDLAKLSSSGNFPTDLPGLSL